MLLLGKCCPWFFSCRELSQASGTIFGAFLVGCCFLAWKISLNDRTDGSKNLLRDKPSCPSAAGTASAAAARAAGQNSCLLQQEPLHPPSLCTSTTGSVLGWNTAAFVLLEVVLPCQKDQSEADGRAVKIQIHQFWLLSADFCFPSHCAL